jgi:Na+-transporting methylmalonyl-CoA/oxaloacetate decarboxylase gamma subunit
MDSALDMLEKGQVGVVTLLGMGGVFMALLFLYVFTSLLGNRYRRRKSARAAEVSNPLSGQEKPSSPPGQEFKGDELAAAVAVAIALGRKNRKRVPVPAPGDLARQESTWRAAGRLALMKPLSQNVRPERD